MLITPSHDHISVAPRDGSKFTDNLLVTTGALNRLSPEESAEANTELPEGIRKSATPGIAVRLGGNSRRYTAGGEAFKKLGDQLITLQAKIGGSLVIIASRRTPKRHLRTLSKQLEGLPHHIWDGTGGSAEDNPYPGILGLANIIIVTSDSVNMTSEVCITGKPVLSVHLA